MKTMATTINYRPFATFPGSDRLPGLLMECTAMQDDFRFHMARPWEEGDYVYASDGRIIGRMLASLMDEEVRAGMRREARLPRDVGAMFEGIEYGDTPAIVPDFPDPYRYCGPCAGNGFRGPKSCRFCTEGTWFRGPEAYRGKDCPICNGAGKYARPCRECDGTGFVHTYEPEDGRWVEVGHLVLDRHYLWILRRYGASIFLPEGKAKPVKFVASDIEGRFMPVDIYR